MGTLERAISIAASAHEHQVDKAGAPYVLHPLRVMASVDGIEAKTVAVLHDVVEDTSWTLDQLRAEGFEENIVQAVDTVTHRAGETYEDYVARAGENAMGLKVKIADLRDNSDLTRLPMISAKDRERIERYRRALEYLEGEEAVKVRAPLVRAMTTTTSVEQLELDVPSGTILATDFYVTGIEKGEALDWGYAVGRVENIDHHAPTKRMARRISSAHLAIERVKQRGPAAPDEAVVINHTDCDSVISAAILLGLVPPSEQLGRAAEAADHTGETDEIADALQALDSRKDFALSLRTLRRLCYGASAGIPGAELEIRSDRRSKATASLESFQHEGAVAWAVLDDQVDGELFPALLPNAEVIVVGYRAPESGRWLIKVRLGLAAREGSSLQDLELPQLDPAYGGRWNAGSNKRGGGSVIGPDAYARYIAQQLGSRVGSPT